MGDSKISGSGSKAGSRLQGESSKKSSVAGGGPSMSSREREKAREREREYEESIRDGGGGSRSGGSRVALSHSGSTSSKHKIPSSHSHVSSRSRHSSASHRPDAMPSSSRSHTSSRHGSTSHHSSSSRLNSLGLSFENMSIHDSSRSSRSHRDGSSHVSSHYKTAPQTAHPGSLLSATPGSASGSRSRVSCSGSASGSKARPPSVHTYLSTSLTDRNNRAPSRLSAILEQEPGTTGKSSSRAGGSSSRVSRHPSRFESHEDTKESSTLNKDRLTGSTLENSKGSSSRREHDPTTDWVLGNGSDDSKDRMRSDASARGFYQIGLLDEDLTPNDSASRIGSRDYRREHREGSRTPRSEHHSSNTPSNSRYGNAKIVDAVTPPKYKTPPGQKSLRDILDPSIPSPRSMGLTRYDPPSIDGGAGYEKYPSSSGYHTISRLDSGHYASSSTAGKYSKYDNGAAARTGREREIYYCEGAYGGGRTESSSKKYAPIYAGYPDSRDYSRSDHHPRPSFSPRHHAMPPVPHSRGYADERHHRGGSDSYARYGMSGDRSRGTMASENWSHGRKPGRETIVRESEMKFYDERDGREKIHHRRVEREYREF